jgi:hypothetical protein
MNPNPSDSGADRGSDQVIVAREDEGGKRLDARCDIDKLYSGEWQQR